MIKRYGLIVASGDIDDYTFHRAALGQLPAPHKVYCADGGLRHVKRLEIKPDLIIGDFDSADAAMLDEYRAMGVALERLPADKDFTDTEFAAVRAVCDGCGAILVFGAFGSRVDHVYANLQLSHKFALRGVRVALANAKCVAAALAPGDAMIIKKNNVISSMLNLPDHILCTHDNPPDFTAPQMPDIFAPHPPLFAGPIAMANPKLSIFPAGGAVKILRASGLKYALPAAPLPSDYTSGVSNEFTGGEASLEIGEGVIYVMVCDD